MEEIDIVIPAHILKSYNIFVIAMNYLFIQILCTNVYEAQFIKAFLDWIKHADSKHMAGNELHFYSVKARRTAKINFPSGYL